MDIGGLLKNIQKSFQAHRDVDFDEQNLHFRLEPITPEEELKILEACKDVEGARYINYLKNYSLAYGIKRINDLDLTRDEVTFTDEQGQSKTQTKFLFLGQMIEKWPTPLRDILFEAYQNLQEELEDKIKKTAKFARFVISPEPTESETAGAPAGFRKVKEPTEDAGMTEVERLNQRIKNESDQVESRMAQTENEAMKREK